MGTPSPSPAAPTSHCARQCTRVRPCGPGRHAPRGAVGHSSPRPAAPRPTAPSGARSTLRSAGAERARARHRPPRTRRIAPRPGRLPPRAHRPGTLRALSRPRRPRSPRRLAGDLPDRDQPSPPIAGALQRGHDRARGESTSQLVERELERPIHQSVDPQPPCRRVQVRDRTVTAHVERIHGGQPGFAQSRRRGLRVEGLQLMDDHVRALAAQPRQGPRPVPGGASVGVARTTVASPT